MKNKRRQGELFEHYGTEFLKEKGYIILAKNYYTKFGELDIIAEKGNVLIFVEVKQRSTDIFGTGEYSINYRKRRRMYLSAKQYIVANRYFDRDIRFDALIFRGQRRRPCNWIKNIIWGDEIGF